MASARMGAVTSRKEIGVWACGRELRVKRGEKRCE